MTATLLWTAFYVFLALLVVAMIVKAITRRTRGDDGPRFHGPR
jgi:hypothetical protein